MTTALERTQPPAMTPDQIDRQINARSRVDTVNGCLIFEGCKNPRGYGSVRINKRTVLAHRAVWESLYGPIPNGLEICHRCDNPSCVWPDHLFLGTRRDNQHDMYSKNRGRKASGEAHHMVKLTDDQVRDLRSKRAAGYSYMELARIFGMSKSGVFSLANGMYRRNA